MTLVFLKHIEVAGLLRFFNQGILFPVFAKNIMNELTCYYRLR